jgi:integrase
VERSTVRSLVEGPPKTDSGRRTVSLPTFLRDMLAEHLARHSVPTDPAARVFTGPKGAPICANNFRKRAFHAAVLSAGVDADLMPHDLRDTAATIAFSHGATVKEVQRVLVTRRRQSRSSGTPSSSSRCRHGPTNGSTRPSES